MKQKAILILILGLILRLVLSAITFHADIRAFDLGGQIVGQGNILNMYDYLGRLDPNNALVRTYTAELLIYPPLIYIYHGIFSSIFSIFFSSQFLQQFLINYQQTLGGPALNFHLIFLKIPYILFDFLAGIFLTKLFKESKDKLIALGLWVFNPINLFATYMMGQFDIIPTFFVVLALYFLQNDRVKNNYLVALSLGIGMAFKIYPLFLLVPLAQSERNIREKAQIFLVGLSPYLFSVIPFLGSKGFRSSALVAGQTLKSLYAQIPISGGESLVLFPLFLILFYLIFAFARSSKEELWEQFFIVLLLFFIFTHYHPQWFLWVTPFMIIDLIKNKFKHLWLVVLSIISFTSLLFFFDSGLNIGIFSPIFPSLYNIPTLWQIIHLNIDYNFWRSILQTVFASVGGYFIIYYFPRLEKR